FGASYRSYQARTGMYLPPTVSRMLPRLLPEAGRRRTPAKPGGYLGGTLKQIALPFQLPDSFHSRVSAVYTHYSPVLSLARLNDEELNGAYRIAETDTGVQATLARAEAAKLIVYVVPQSWGLPDLPIDAHPNTDKFGGHFTPENFDRRYYKVLF